MYTKEDGWWKDNNMIAIVVEWMCKQGYEPSEVGRAVAKPYNYSDELNQAIKDREGAHLTDEDPMAAEPEQNLAPTGEFEEDQYKWGTTRQGQGERSGLGRSSITAEDILREMEDIEDCECGPDCDCPKCKCEVDEMEIDEG